MRRFAFVRLIGLVVIALIGLSFAAQSFGTVDGRAVSPTSAQAQANTSFSMEWAAAGLSAGGVLIFLLRPRRRRHAK